METTITIARCYKGNAARLCVVDWNEEAVYLVSRDRMTRLERGDRSVMPIGFPWQDVYKNDPKADLSKPIDWGALRPLRPEMIQDQKSTW